MANSSITKNRSKNGLGLMCLGILISIIISIVFSLFAFNDNSKNIVLIIKNVSYIVSNILIIIGLIFCISSGQKYFSRVLFTYILLIIWLIVIAVVTQAHPSYPKLLDAFVYIFITFAHISFLLALKSLGANSKFNNVVITLSIIILTIAFILTIVNAFVVLKYKTYVQGFINILRAIEEILFLIGIFTTYITLNKQSKIQ